MSVVGLFYYSSKSILNLGQKTYSIVSQEFKQINFLNNFKKSIRKWIPAYWSLQYLKDLH